MNNTEILNKNSEIGVDDNDRDAENTMDRMDRTNRMNE